MEIYGVRVFEYGRVRSLRVAFLWACSSNFMAKLVSAEPATQANFTTIETT